MYRRFLRDEDYLSVITKEALIQLTRGSLERFIQVEEAAEMSIVEHLCENCEIEQELKQGKYITPYDRSVSYPVGVYVVFKDKIYKVIRSLSRYKTPADRDYWEESDEANMDLSIVKNYSQFETYYINDTVLYNDVLYKCLSEKGFDFGDIRIPLVNGWIKADHTPWMPMEYSLWEIVKYKGSFYTLLSLEDFDNNINPYQSDNWGAIADYSREYNSYDLSAH